jgi:8-oxo-dGTP pyrophosphatase MutT (NUDIX family)
MILNGKTPIAKLDLRHTNDRWTFAERERARIDVHWETIAAANPALWNGEVLMCHTMVIDAGVLRGQFLTTDFASFVAWRDWGLPDQTISNVFGSAAVISSDGALVYGRMSRATLNAGKVYPPGGSLEPRDITADGTVDVLGSIERELAEETGLEAREARADGWIAIQDGPRLALVRALRFDAAAEEIAERVSRHIAEAVEDELDGVEIIRSRSQIDSRVPPYAAEIARHFLEN